MNKTKHPTRKENKDTPVLTDDEVDLLTTIVVEYSQHGPLTDEELRRALKWAHKTRIDGATLDLVLEGLLVMSWDRDADTVRFWTTECRAN